MSRFSYFLMTSASVMGVSIPAYLPTSHHLIWNASASVPIGLYVINSPSTLKVGDLVAFMPEEPLAAFMVGRGYIGRDTPLIKHVAALPGQQVCRADSTVTVDEMPVGDALDRDRQGRPLPVWRGCKRVAEGEIFLMNRSVPDSLDGRYFGTIRSRAILGKVSPVYTVDDGDGRYIWRAAAH